jgi:predicted nucleotidyltransferase
MNRSDVVNKLKTVEPVLRAHGVGALYLFGSFSRDEGQSDSDVDIFVEAANEGFYDLSHYMGAYEELKDAFPGMRIGYSTREGLSKYVRPIVEQEALRVF